MCQLISINAWNIGADNGNVKAYQMQRKQRH